MKCITLAQLIEFHRRITIKTGGSDGVRDKGLLESALNRPFATFSGEDLYTPIERKIAVVTHSLISNHGFVDGNKRIGVSTMILLSKLNNIKLEFTQEELVELGIGTAEGKYLEEDIEVNESEALQKTLDKVKEPVENDNVNHPSHYTDGNIEVMDFIEDKQLNFTRGNVIKYVSRAGKKDPNKELEDLKKAMWYLNREIERLEKEKK